MKKIIYNFAILLLITGIFFSCKKNFSEETFTPTPPSPAFPDLTTAVTASVTGFVSDESGVALYGATVTAGNKTASTDQYGYFEIKDASLVKDAGFVKVSKSGYFLGYKTFKSKAGKSSFVKLRLITKTNAGDVNSATGGTVTTVNGAIVTLPANAVVVAAGSAAYSGTVHIAAKQTDPSDVNNALLQMPGDGRGTDTDGHLKQLRSFGVLAVELTGDAGQLLQIAAGSHADINIPIPAAMVSSAPATLALWSFDETKGLWKQEGTATKTGNKYSGSVSHFSFWTGAVGVQMVNLTVQVVDAALHLVANAPVVIDIQGQPINAGYGSFGFTDAQGFVQGGVFANNSFVLNVLTPCNLPAYSHNFSTTTNDVDLGTITGNLGQSEVTFTGTINNCSGQPVTDGYLQTYDNGFYTRINVTNGIFNYTTSACTNAAIHFVTVDNVTHQQSAPQQITLTPGVNNLGTISACGTSTYGSITYTIDGNNFSVTEPANTLAAYWAGPTSPLYTQVLDVVPFPGTSSISFQFDGGIMPGGSQKTYDIFSPNLLPSGRALNLSGLPVTITEYAAPGGFVTGSFSGTVSDFNNQTTIFHTITCNFRIRRNN